MASLGGSGGDLGGVGVADLTDHDDIGVLAQKCSERIGKVQLYFGVDVDLIDALDIDLHRIFTA